MYFFITLLTFILWFLVTLHAFDVGDFHTIFSFIHNDPCILSDIFDLHIPNNVHKYCDSQKHNQIHTFDALDNSAFIHIERIEDLDCPFSHNTCPEFCHIYESCNFYDRIKYYLDPEEDIHKLGEVLRKDNSLTELKVIHDFVLSPSHAEIILDKTFNFYGFAYYKKYFSINMLQSPSTLSSKSFDSYELKDTKVSIHENDFLLTLNSNCLFDNIVYNNTGMYIYKI